jgi:hypothetical protein
VDTPVGMQGDIVKFLTQFQSYNVKQTEFVTEMVQNKEWGGMMRWLGANLAIIGGMGTLLGVEVTDLFPPLGILTGDTKVGQTPPIQFAQAVGGALVDAPDEYGNKRDMKTKLKDVGKTLTPFVPAGVQIKKTIDGLTSGMKGYSETESGNIRFPVSGIKETAQAAILGQYTLPQAREYVDSGFKTISGNSAEYLKSAVSAGANVKDTFNQLKGEQQARAEENQIKADLEKADEGSATLNDKIFYRKDGETKTINIGKVANMPEKSQYERILKQKKAFTLVDDIMDNLPEDQQDEALKKLGVSPQEATYYQVARQENDAKYAYVTELLASDKDPLDLVFQLRRKVNGKEILSSGVIDQMYKDGLITKAQAKYFKAIKIDEKTGKPTVDRDYKASGSSKKLVSDAQLLAAYEKALKAAYAPVRGIKIPNLLNEFKPIRLKRTQIKSLR